MGADLRNPAQAGIRRGHGIEAAQQKTPLRSRLGFTLAICALAALPLTAPAQTKIPSAAEQKRTFDEVSRQISQGPSGSARSLPLPAGPGTYSNGKSPDQIPKVRVKPEKLFAPDAATRAATSRGQDGSLTIDMTKVQQMRATNAWRAENQPGAQTIVIKPIAPKPVEPPAAPPAQP